MMLMTVRGMWWCAGQESAEAVPPAGVSLNAQGAGVSPKWRTVVWLGHWSRLNGGTLGKVYPDEVRRRAVELYRLDERTTYVEVGRDLGGISGEAVTNWCCQAHRDGGRRRRGGPVAAGPVLHPL